MKSNLKVRAIYYVYVGHNITLWNIKRRRELHLNNKYNNEKIVYAQHEDKHKRYSMIEIKYVMQGQNR